jgi:hypothetical protein
MPPTNWTFEIIDGPTRRLLELRKGRDSEMIIILLFDIRFPQNVSFILLLLWCSDLLQALVNTSPKQPFLSFLGYTGASFDFLNFPLCRFYCLFKYSGFIKLVWISLGIHSFMFISSQSACGKHHCIILIRLWNFKKQIILCTLLLVLKLVEFSSQQLVQKYLLLFSRHTHYVFFFGLILNWQELFRDRSYRH